jgi:hypothetical protein
MMENLGLVKLYAQAVVSAVSFISCVIDIKNYGKNKK